MTHEEVIVELTKDLYTVRTAYKEEQEKSDRHYQWYKGNEAAIKEAEDEIFKLRADINRLNNK